MAVIVNDFYSLEYMSHWALLCQKNFVSPIHSAVFERYFSSTRAHEEFSVLSCISIIGNRPVAGLALNQRNADGEVHLDFFGQAGLLIADADSRDSEQGLVEISEFLSNRGVRSLIKSKDAKFNISFGRGTLNNPGRLLETLLRESDAILPDMARYRNLSSMREKNQTFENINWSRPVQTAIKISRASGITTLVLDSSSLSNELEEAFHNFRALHLAAAGRVTRPSSSWDEQLGLIRKDKAFLAVAQIDQHQIGGAIFFKDSKIVAYASGANHPDHSSLPLGHLVQLAATKYCFENNLDVLWVGSQFSEKSRAVSQKEKDIEKFKSMFGESLSILIKVVKR